MQICPACADLSAQDGDGYDGRGELRRGSFALTWSRALLKLVIEELYPDDLFAELVGGLDRIPRRQWPHVIAIAVALRHSWRRDGLTRVARRLRVSLTTDPSHERSRSHTRPSRHRFSG